MNGRFLTYVYCLVKSAKAPSNEKPPPSLPKMAPARWLEVGGGQWLLVSDAPDSMYSEAALEEGLKDIDWVSRCALAHQAMVEHASTATAVVPMKLFTLFRGDERTVEHFARQKQRLSKVIAKVTGCEEYGVRLSLDERQVAKLAEERAEAAVGGGAPGASYLLRKKSVKESMRGLAEQARITADEAFESLADKAHDAKARPPAAAVSEGGRLLLDAAYLVKRPQAASFRESVEKLAAAIEPDGYTVTLTGPWPPYNFIG